MTTTVTLFGHDYRVIGPSLRDPRLHVAAVLLTLQVLGQTVLDFRLSIAQILLCLAAGALIEFGVAFFKDRAIMWPASGLLTGNSTAFILRTPGTLHGQWWSLHGIWIFLGVVAISMLSKYLIRWRGRHIFNPSNLGLVIAFVALGPRYTEPQDLWWIPGGPWLALTYSILLVGGLLIGWELKLLGLEIAFLGGFAAFAALALTAAPDHCMVASWHVTPLCGFDLWSILVTSPELLVFALFMIPDPKTVPDGQVARLFFGLLAGLFSVLLLGPTALEFWTKTAILASLVIACALRFGLGQALSPLEAGLRATMLRRRGWQLVPVLVLTALLIEALPLSAMASTYGPQPAAGLSDGSLPVIGTAVGQGQPPSAWLEKTALEALPPVGNVAPASGTARIWVLPSLPVVAIAPNVAAFDGTLNPATATRMAHGVVLALVIEAEARRVHDADRLAAQGAGGDALGEFRAQINADSAAGRFVQTAYSFDSVSLVLYLPKFSTQAARLVGVSLHGTATLTVRNASGALLSQSTVAYAKSWSPANPVIVNDYTDLTPA